MDRSKRSSLHSLSRSALSTCIQWITGFCNLQPHKKVKDATKTVSDVCRLCKAEIETPEHLSFFCPRLTKARSNCFLTLHGPPDDWKPKSILRFINTTVCKDLLVDDTDYSNK